MQSLVNFSLLDFSHSGLGLRQLKQASGILEETVERDVRTLRGVSIVPSSHTMKVRNASYKYKCCLFLWHDHLINRVITDLEMAFRATTAVTTETSRVGRKWWFVVGNCLNVEWTLIQYAKPNNNHQLQICIVQLCHIGSAYRFTTVVDTILDMKLALTNKDHVLLSTSWDPPRWRLTPCGVDDGMDPAVNFYPRILAQQGALEHVSVFFELRFWEINGEIPESCYTAILLYFLRTLSSQSMVFSSFFIQKNSKK